MKYPQLVSMPSAVSDWLEEQLEARGIDAVLYTRYILSLLHSDTVDVIYSDEDLHFSHLNKEVRRSGGSRKRFRRSSDWWKHAQADAEKLRRSAAVECLMSASEQTCGIESLIDELCEKLNEVKSEATVDPPTKKSNPELQQVSPQELAKRYYAAFPPLTRTSSPTKLISFKWIPSPKKKSANRKQKGKDDTMKARAAGKQRLYYTGRKKTEPKKTEKAMEQQDWNMNEDANMYDDLPVDIKELLDDEPTSHDVTVEMMNLANMRDTGRRGFIPCGTNITSSIWTNEAAIENNTLFDNSVVISDSVLDLQFSSISINNKLDWDNFAFVRDDDRNVFLQHPKWDIPTWSDDSGCFEDDQAFNHFTLSLMKLNHKKDDSAFAEIHPTARSQAYNPFSKIIGSSRDTSLKTIDIEKEKDDLLTSVHSHFRPINEKVDNYLQGQYADGATFIVSNTWDKINYRRTESGAMYMENDYSMRKKYCEYKMKNGPTNVEFVLKYLVCQNDKGCQTDDVDAEVEAINLQMRGDAASNECTCRTLADDCPVHPGRSDSATTGDIWGQQRQMTACDKCNNNSALWNTNTDNFGNARRELGWQFGTMSKIWSGGVVCHACLGRPPSTLQHSKLREDVSQDGDQLLSDLSTMQKSYMESLPLTEITCDITEFLKERKRRHSLMAPTLPEWSFASDCIIQMSTIPTLRSVTL